MASAWERQQRIASLKDHLHTQLNSEPTTKSLTFYRRIQALFIRLSTEPTVLQNLDSCNDIILDLRRLLGVDRYITVNEYLAVSFLLVGALDVDGDEEHTFECFHPVMVLRLVQDLNWHTHAFQILPLLPNYLSLLRTWIHEYSSSCSESGINDKTSHEEESPTSKPIIDELMQQYIVTLLAREASLDQDSSYYDEVLALLNETLLHWQESLKITVELYQAMNSLEGVLQSEISRISQSPKHEQSTNSSSSRLQLLCGLRARISLLLFQQQQQKDQKKIVDDDTNKAAPSSSSIELQNKQEHWPSISEDIESYLKDAKTAWEGCIGLDNTNKNSSIGPTTAAQQQPCMLLSVAFALTVSSFPCTSNSTHCATVHQALIKLIKQCSKFGRGGGFINDDDGFLHRRLTLMRRYLWALLITAPYRDNNERAHVLQSTLPLVRCSKTGHRDDNNVATDVDQVNDEIFVNHWKKQLPRIINQIIADTSSSSGGSMNAIPTFGELQQHVDSAVQAMFIPSIFCPKESMSFLVDTALAGFAQADACLAILRKLSSLAHYQSSSFSDVGALHTPHTNTNDVTMPYIVTLLYRYVVASLDGQLEDRQLILLLKFIKGTTAICEDNIFQRAYTVSTSKAAVYGDENDAIDHTYSSSEQQLVSEADILEHLVLKVIHEVPNWSDKDPALVHEIGHSMLTNILTAPSTIESTNRGYYNRSTRVADILSTAVQELYIDALRIVDWTKRRLDCPPSSKHSTNTTQQRKLAFSPETTEQALLLATACAKYITTYCYPTRRAEIVKMSIEQGYTDALLYFPTARYQKSKDEGEVFVYSEEKNDGNECLDGLISAICEQLREFGVVDVVKNNNKPLPPLQLLRTAVVLACARMIPSCTPSEMMSKLQNLVHNFFLSSLQNSDNDDEKGQATSSIVLVLGMEILCRTLHALIALPLSTPIASSQEQKGVMGVSVERKVAVCRMMQHIATWSRHTISSTSTIDSEMKRIIYLQCFEHVSMLIDALQPYENLFDLLGGGIHVVVQSVLVQLAKAALLESALASGDGSDSSKKEATRSVLLHAVESLPSNLNLTPVLIAL